MRLIELRALLDYHYWARDRTLHAAAELTPEEYARDLRSSFPSVRDTLVHTYSAEWIWCSRWQGTSPSAMLQPGDYPTLEVLRAAWKQHEQRMRALLEELGETGVTKVIAYRTIAGKEVSSVFWHMLQHVVNHATYHRGQVTTMMRQLGAKPPLPTDLIAFYRER